MIRLHGVSKRFGDVRALDEVSLDLRAGEVHCLLGENGAGKSTLIALLTGLQQPDAGVIELDGAPVTLRSPRAAIDRGIAVVHQHSTLAPTMTVLENLRLVRNAGRAEKPTLLLDRRTAEQELSEWASDIGADIDPGTLMAELSLGQQQQFEIARALRQRPRVLILDEPTSMLPSRSVPGLIRDIHRLREQGAAVLVVTHKLEEALELANTVTVLRGGRVTAHLAAAELRRTGDDAARAQILTAMFGAGSGAEAPTHAPTHAATDAGMNADAPERLSIERLRTERGDGGSPLDGLSLEVRAGEIVGIAGIDGNGQRHLAEAIAGQRPVAAGSIRLDGSDITAESVRARQRLGVRYLTDDKLGEGSIGGFSVALNLMLKRVGERPFWRFGFVNRAALAAEARRLIEDSGIGVPSPETRAGTLSGGNLQKLLLARELQGEPRVVVFNKPSTGLDLRTVRRVHRAVRVFASRGGAALVISADLDELIALSHRIAVVSRGRIVGEIVNDPAPGEGEVRARLGELLAGVAARSEAGAQ